MSMSGLKVGKAYDQIELIPVHREAVIQVSQVHHNISKSLILS